MNQPRQDLLHQEPPRRNPDTAEAQDVLTIDRYAHLVGGCVMSATPETGVVDADHRAWSVSNLFVCDGSVMPTQGSANPALTIMALASRLVERLGEKRIDPAASGRLGPAREPRARIHSPHAGDLVLKAGLAG